MRQFASRTSLLMICMAVAISFTACKDKKAEVAPTTTETPMAPTTAPTAPVQVDNDASLKQSVATAVKDYPGVMATVMNGEVTLTGNLERSKLPNLMAAVQATHPGKVNNNITLK